MFQKTSRRSDIISIYYLLVYLLNENSFPGLNQDYQNLTVSKKFKMMINYKRSFEIEKVIKEFKIYD